MKTAEYRDVQAKTMSEAELQALVIALAQRLGWLVYHTHDSRRSQPGFPDLTLVRGGRLIFAELKSEKGRLTPEQSRWAGELLQVDPVRVLVAVWRPGDWFDGTIAAFLGADVRGAA